jgi:hypothetical protein
LQQQQDKKRRQYLITALPDTKVDLKGVYGALQQPFRVALDSPAVTAATCNMCCLLPFSPGTSS